MRMSSRDLLLIIVLPAIYFLTGVIIVAGSGYYWYNYEKSPSQPIAYNHEIHIKKAGLECTDCHKYVDKSPRATVPDLQTCMTCHRSVGKDNPEVKKLREHWEKKEPVRWNRVYSTPDHVRFTHKRHIKAGIKCQKCHGQVEAMTTARRVRTLQMGWCLNCHRTYEAPTDCMVCHK